MTDLGMTVPASVPDEEGADGRLKPDAKTQEWLTDVNARMLDVMDGAKGLLFLSE